jgi:hypothetical protein
MVATLFAVISSQRSLRAEDSISIGDERLPSGRAALRTASIGEISLRFSALGALCVNAFLCVLCLLSGLGQ